MGREDAAQAGLNGNASPLNTRTSSLNSSMSAGSTSLRRKPITGQQPPTPPSELPPPPPPKHSVPFLDKRISNNSAFSFEQSSYTDSQRGSRDIESQVTGQLRDSGNYVPAPQSIPSHHGNVENGMKNLRLSHTAEISSVPHVSEPYNDDGYEPSGSPIHDEEEGPEMVPQLQYFHQLSNAPKGTAQGNTPRHMQSPSTDSRSSSERGAYNGSRSELQLPQTTTPRPASAYALGSDMGLRGRTHSPHLSVGNISPGGSPVLQGQGRSVSASRRSPETRPISYVDLLNIPYSQQVAPSANIGNTSLRSAVGQNASLLDTKKTLEMYRLNVKKTQDNAVQYEFAIFMVQVARDLMNRPPGTDGSGLDPAELLKEARNILQRLADRSYPFAQYYLADGYASGFFNKGKEDYDRAFPLFVAASKHGHAEAGYRTALCYEFGWGCRKDYAKAVQFYRASASRNHPGAATRLGKACLLNDMGLTDKYREGLKWLKRAAESADQQYNAGPYELGLLHETGFGPDCFKDEGYAAQLFTQAAELGHPQANLRMGEAYEHGFLQCPRDPALSVHFYNGAAQAGNADAMMNLCAWYMVGAEPVLDKDENEAYEWAKNAAELGLPKAEYAIGYFTEMGIGCRRDPLEANVWYVKAADKGDDRAKQRLAIIRAAASGEPGVSQSGASPTDKKLKKGDKDCIVM